MQAMNVGTYLFLLAHHGKGGYKIDVLNEINNTVVVIIQHAEEIIFCCLARGLQKVRQERSKDRSNNLFAVLLMMQYHYLLPSQEALCGVVQQVPPWSMCFCLLLFRHIFQRYPWVLLLLERVLAWWLQHHNHSSVSCYFHTPGCIQDSGLNGFSDH